MASSNSSFDKRSDENGKDNNEVHQKVLKAIQSWTMKAAPEDATPKSKWVHTVDKTQAPKDLECIHTMFGEIREKNVVFCIDVSGSLYLSLDAVKKHLLECLLKHAFKEGKAMFNIIAFSDEVEMWTDQLVECTPDTIAVASEWVNKLQTRTGSRLLDALLAAFKDPRTDAVYLATDGYPDQDRASILEHVMYMGRGRPVHCLLVSDQDPPARQAAHFMQALAEETYGSLSLVAVTTHGTVERVTPLYRSPQCLIPPPRMMRSKNGQTNHFVSLGPHLHGDPLMEHVFTAPHMTKDPLTGDIAPAYHPYNHWPWPWWTRYGTGMSGSGGSQETALSPFYALTRHRAGRAFIQGKERLDFAQDDPYLAPSAGAILIGRRVLAQKKTNGVYCMGTIKSQVGSHEFIVEFPAEDGDFDPVLQETCLADVISYDDGHRHAIGQGDTVLAPYGEKEGQYWTARVVEGDESRNSKFARNDIPLTITWTGSGTRHLLPANVAVWIPLHVFNRICSTTETAEGTQEPLKAITDGDIDNIPDYNGVATTNGLVGNGARNTKCDWCPDRRWMVGDQGSVLPLSGMPVFPRGGQRQQNDRATASASEIEERAKLLNRRSVKEPAMLDVVDDVLQKKRDEKDGSQRKSSSEKEGSQRKSSSEKEEILTSDDEDKSVVSDDEELYENSREYNRYGNAHFDSYGDANKFDKGVGTDFRLFLANRPTRSPSPPGGRPPWRYWNTGIPTLLEPPIWEPYEPASNWGASLEKSIVYHTESGPQVEWPSPNFRVIDNTVHTKYDPNKMYEFFRHTPQRPSTCVKKDVAVETQTPAKPWGMGRDGEAAIVERRHDHMYGGYPNVPPPQPNRDHVRELLKDRADDRILAQLTRDEMNRVNYSKKLDKHTEKDVPKKERKKLEKERKKMEKERKKHEDGGWMQDRAKAEQHAAMARRQFSAAS